MEGVNVNRPQLQETPRTNGISVGVSTNLRDLLNVRDELITPNDHHGDRNGHHGDRNETMTLATVLACEKQRQQPLSPASTTDATGGRTLLDVIRLDNDTRHVIANPVNRRPDRPQGMRWKAIKSLLRLRRVATWPNSPNPTTMVAATSPPIIMNSSDIITVNDVELNWPPPPPEQENGGGPIRPSLMALLEEGDGRNGDGEPPPFARALMGVVEDGDGDGDEEEGEEEEESVEIGGKVKGRTYVCCVCMIRHKGAAFIPCGHTFCRLCSRELWVSRGNCPLCNGFILEILDIF